MNTNRKSGTFTTFSADFRIYNLDANCPFCLRSAQGKKTDAFTVDDVLNWAAVNNMSPETKEDLCGEVFRMWVGHRNPATAAKISKMTEGKTTTDMLYAVLYSLNPKTGFMLTLNDTADNYYFTPQKIGELLNDSIDGLLNSEDPGQRESCKNLLGQLTKLEGSELYFFLKSKDGLYDKWIDWIKYCMDEGSEDNVEKAGPYSTMMGIYKTIKGLGHTPYYRLSLSGKTISSPKELVNIDRKELKVEFERVEYDVNPLETWLSVFYQEDSALDLQQKYTYEKKLSEMLEFIDSLKVNDKNVEAYKNAQREVDKMAHKLTTNLKLVNVTRIILSVVCFLPLVAAALLAAFFWHPTENYLDPMELFPVFCGIFSVMMLFITRLSGKFIGELIWGSLIGGVVSGIIYGSLQFILPYAPYAVAAIPILIGVALYFKCFRLQAITDKNINELLSPGFEQRILEPLYYAYHPNDDGTFDSSIRDRSQTMFAALKKVRKDLFVKVLPVSAITIAGVIYLNSSPIFDDSRKAIVKEEKTVEFVGKWEGKVGDDTAELEFVVKEEKAEKSEKAENAEKEEKGSIDAVIEINSSPKVWYELFGTYNDSTKTIDITEVYRLRSRGRKKKDKSEFTLAVGEEGNLTGTMKKAGSEKTRTMIFTPKKTSEKDGVQ